MQPGTIKAAQYVRMSTEHQKYSIEFQTATIAAYALAHGIDIVRTYQDAGISGLTFEKRPGLRQLLADVLAGGPGFEVVLVYDVSRWGRFQDPDEGAHYEFLCRSAGVRLAYCAEPFHNDGSLVASLIKSLKRAMAAEFSRELSNRVWKAQRGLASKGYKMGGQVGYGLSRVLLGDGGQPKAVLRPGERNAIRGERVVLAPGPPREVQVVRWIFRQFVRERMTIREISDDLNARGVPASYGKMWSIERVRALLGNEAYIGTLVMGKFHNDLGRRTPQPAQTWLKVPRAFAPVISRSLYAKAQALRQVNKPTVPDHVLLDELRGALTRAGRLSAKVIADDPATHCPAVYRARFGSLSAAYSKIGYEMSAQQRSVSLAAHRDRPHLQRRAVDRLSDDEALSRLRSLLKTQGRLSQRIIEDAPDIPCPEALGRRFGGLANLYKLLGYEPTPKQVWGLRLAQRGAA